MLKILAKVLYPDSGSVRMNGKVASFLELGVGFQLELTAKGNVYIYSSILGMSRKEVNEKYHAIFDFAELRKFENMKLKNFSSGMYMRLAFSTAVHASPDSLLIDEVFAVGDEAFQKKCIAKIDEFREQGKTIVFVSHDLNVEAEEDPPQVAPPLQFGAYLPFPRPLVSGEEGRGVVLLLQSGDSGLGAVLSCHQAGVDATPVVGLTCLAASLTSSTWWP